MRARGGGESSCSLDGNLNCPFAALYSSRVSCQARCLAFRSSTTVVACRRKSLSYDVLRVWFPNTALRDKLAILPEHIFGWKWRERRAFFLASSLFSLQIPFCPERKFLARRRPSIRPSDSLGRDGRAAAAPQSGGRAEARREGAVKTISDKDFKTSRRNMPRLHWIQSSRRESGSGVQG